MEASLESRECFQAPCIPLRWVGGSQGGPCGNDALVSVHHMSFVTLGVAPVLPATSWELGEQFAGGLRGAYLSCAPGTRVRELS